VGAGSILRLPCYIRASLNLLVVPEAVEIQDFDFAPPQLEANTFSPTSKAFIKAKFEACKTDHASCRVGMGDFLPTRLIDTGDPSERLARVVGKDDVLPKHYATLSHCWGGVSATILTTENKSVLERTISIDTLPITFQHAINVTRFLGIRYLWIDSLCIIQDSVADWEAESSLMARVYSHAAINIAATSASNSSGGLFFDRDPQVVAPFAAYASWEGVHRIYSGWNPNSSSGGRGCGEMDEANLLSSWVPKGWYIYKNSDRWSDIGKEALNRRGWVMQERLLSPRTLHFTSSEVIWQCLEEVSSESVPDQHKEDGRTEIGDYTDLKLTMTAIKSKGMTSESREKIYKYWWQLVKHYSDCGLTKDEDKLVAISGITDHLESLIGDQCLAGLWRGHMPICLLWAVEWYQSGVPRWDLGQRRQPTQWRAPSWSWASHNLPVAFPYISGVATCHVEVVEATAPRKPNGSAVSGKLRLRGPLVEAKFATSHESVTVMGSDGELSVAGGVKAHFSITMDGNSPLASTATAMLILEGQKLELLMLQPLDSAENSPPTFRRVGVLSLYESALKEKINWQKFVAGDTETDRGSKWEPYVRLIDIL
jgi:hypothetical protein